MISNLAIPGCDLLPDLDPNEGDPLTPISGDAEDAAALGTKRVLVLDDDPTFNEILQDFLSESGYAVTAVRSGVEGVQEVLAGDFAVILCDMMMPALPGDMFYRAVERTRPHLCGRFVFMTGLRGDEKANAFIEKVNGHGLRKPFRLDDLLDTIRFIETRGRFADAPAPKPLGERDRSSDDREIDSPAQEAIPPPETKAPIPESGPLPRAATARSNHSASKTALVEKQPEKALSITGVCLGLMLVAVAAVLVAWYFDLRERAAASSSQLLALESQWTAVSTQLGEAETARATAEALLLLPQRLKEDRDAPKWTLALRSIAMLVGADVELTDIRVREEPKDQGARDLRIDGVGSGPAPRAAADRFRQVLETVLKQHFNQPGVTPLFERLEDKPNSPSAPGDERKAAFTIIAAAESKTHAAPERSEGR